MKKITFIGELFGKTKEECKEETKRYDEIYDKFVDLINHKIDKVELTMEDIAYLDKPSFEEKASGQLYKRYNYGDILRNMCYKHNISQTFNPATNTYLFKSEVE
jgi:hypothetical protein